MPSLSGQLAAQTLADLMLDVHAFDSRALAVANTTTVQRIGVIDCGSNAIRAAIADVAHHRWLNPMLLGPVQRRRAAVRLGTDVFHSGRIGDETARAAQTAVAEFSQWFRDNDVTQIRTAATSALRCAENSADVRANILLASGVDLTPISGHLEARMVTDAVLHALGGRTRPSVVADLGGGSLDVTLLGATPRTASLPFGTVRLLCRHGLSGRISGSVASQLVSEVALALRDQLGAPPRVKIAAMCGGNAKCVAKLAGEQRGTFRSIAPESLLSITKRLRRLDPAERRVRFGLRRDRADVVGIGALVYCGVLAWLAGDAPESAHLVVPSVGVLDALLLTQPSTAARLSLI